LVVGKSEDQISRRTQSYFKGEAMRLYYRGVLYEYYPSQSESSSQSFAQSVRILCYRGVLYIRQEQQILRLSRISDEVTHLPEVSQDHAAHPQQIGCLYKLYCIGWQNGSRQSLSLPQHRLLSISFLYRTGYTAGFKWRRHHLEICYQENN
jgi:hypothetical protein